jgi:hypothetical protein
MKAICMFIFCTFRVSNFIERGANFLLVFGNTGETGIEPNSNVPIAFQCRNRKLGFVYRGQI